MVTIARETCQLCDLLKAHLTFFISNIYEYQCNKY